MTLSNKRKYLVFDYETKSEVDLKRSGSYEYAVHPTTDLLCVAWKVGTRQSLLQCPASSWVPSSPIKDVLPLQLALLDPFVIIVAHNALFEQLITEFVFSRYVKLDPIPIARWLCTASLAAALALPRDLEGAGQALALNVQKDKEGKRLMMKHCKPRNPSKHNDAKWFEDEEERARIVQYCATDVDTEAELFLKLPPLPPLERKVWKLDQLINRRGFMVDRELVTAALNLIEVQKGKLEEEVRFVTDGALNSTNQRDKALTWIRSKGVHLPDLRADTVAEALDDDVSNPDVERILEIRQELSKSSTAKYQAFYEKSGSDGRVRDNLLYHGASTGRWGGRGVQPQNFPCGTISNTDVAVECIKEGDLDMLSLLYGNPMDALSSCLRSVIVASPGKELFCGDYAAIEVRVLFWLARHSAGLKIYEQGRDPYKEMAAIIFNKALYLVDKRERGLGKSVILGSGYGMGAEKFYVTCQAMGQNVTEDLAARSIRTYRDVHHPVPTFWYETEHAAIVATRNKGKRCRVGFVTWFFEGDFLYCELPSKRRLAYYKPTIELTTTHWGEKKDALHHWGANSTTKKWEKSSTFGGKLVENITQAVARDLMAEALLRVEDGGYEVILSVHDEILAERTKGTGNLDEFCGYMAAIPVWAKGCPISVEGWVGFRYRK